MARRGISRSFQRTNLFPRLAVRENLRLAAAARAPRQLRSPRLGAPPRVPIERAREAAETVGLTDRLDVPAGRLSYGEQRQLEIGIALATEPRLLLLDEPTAGMSPEETQRMTRDARRRCRARSTLLIIEHDMDVVFTLADRITVLHYGEVLAEGTADEVRADPRVYEVYLGAGVERDARRRGIHTYYGDSHVLHGVSLRVAAGEAVALLGRNGAGKTTLIRSIIGFTPPRDGPRRVEGERDRALASPPHRAARAGAGAAGPAHLRAAHGAREPAARRPAEGGPRWTLERVFELFPRLRERAEPGGRHALRRRAADARASAGRCSTNGRLLLLDEPSEGLAPLIVREIGRILGALKAERLSILLVEQNYHLALAVADRVYVMNKGQIVYEGTPAALEASEDVKRRYLGVA